MTPRRHSIEGIADAKASHSNDISIDTLVIGAGPAGLAIGACLRRAGVPFVIVERGEHVGEAWHHHYERLHLHTDKAHSALPFVSFPSTCPRFPSRLDLIKYLENYARHFQLRPEYGQEVTSVTPSNGGWLTVTDQRNYRSRCLVVATGNTRKPIRPSLAGQEQFRGRIIHSADYRNGKPFQGQRVLVIGFGNSGGEIAIDLYEHGASPALSVRGPVNVIPRDILGIPILSIAIPLSRLPPRVADRLGRLLLKVVVGDYRPFGLTPAVEGPLTSIAQRSRIPLIDVGTMRLIRSGALPVLPGIDRLTKTGVVFVDGRSELFDAIVLATGFHPGLEDLLGDSFDLRDYRRSRAAGERQHGLPGLYLCGFNVVSTGMLREIGLEARAIAAEITRSRMLSSASAGS
jgi:cation diffusion facilitator CzcD-associated flavoprotein CzcO